MSNLSRLRTQRLAKKSKGFTLIELALVAVFLGILSIYAVSQFSGSATDSTRASAMYDASSKLGDSWNMATTGCGISTTVATSPLATTPSAANNLSVLLGNLPASTAYAQCFASSGVKPMSGLTQGATGNETLYGYKVTLGNGATPRQLTVSYAAVPDTIALQMYQKYSSVAGASTATAMPATADTTDSLFRFSAGSGGSRTVTFVIQM